VRGHLQIERIRLILFKIALASFTGESLAEGSIVTWNKSWTISWSSWIAPSDLSWVLVMLWMVNLGFGWLPTSFSTVSTVAGVTGVPVLPDFSAISSDGFFGGGGACWGCHLPPPLRVGEPPRTILGPDSAFCSGLTEGRVCTMVQRTKCAN